MFKFFRYKFSKKFRRQAAFRAVQVFLALVLGIALAAAMVLWQVNKDETRRIQLQNQAIHGDRSAYCTPNSKNIGGPFTLTDQDGKTVSDADFRGKYLLIYFGYTYCPDLCPTGLQSISHALNQLSSDLNKIKVLYITIDPARDTPAKLKQYVASFHPDIVGLTGAPEQIAAAAKAYQVYYAKGEQVDEHDYVMDHSSLIYLMDPDGKFLTTFPENVDPDTLVKALRDQWTGHPDAPKTSEVRFVSGV